MRRHHLARRAEIGFVELVIAVDAEQGQADANFVFEYLEQPNHPLRPGGGQPIDIKPAASHRIGAENDRLDDIGAAADTAIDEHACPPADRLDHFGQHIYRAYSLVELATAMVRHIDAIDPVLERNPGVFGGGDAIQDQRNAADLPDPLDIAPVELGLVAARIGGPHPAALMALGDVALAPAVAVGVDGQAEPVIALVLGAADMLVDPGGIAAHIELKDLEAVARRRGGFL